jgi:hypothetical protein
MRIIKVFNNWTSPGALIAHVLSGEEMTAIHYGGWGPVSGAAIGEAADIAKEMFWAGLIHKLNNVLWVGALLAGVAWPLTKISEDIKHFFILLFGAAFVVALVRLVVLCIARYKFGKFDIDELAQIDGLDLAPPPMAYRETPVKSPSLRHAFMFFIVMVFMNCMVLASPAYPARLNGQYIERNTLVAPWVAWESTIRVQQGSMIAIVTAPETDQIWIARARYVVRQSGPDITNDWLEWTDRRFSYLVNQITQSLFQSIPPDITTDEAIEWITNTWVSDLPEGEGMPTDILRNALITNFQERYEGSFELLLLEINIEHISLSDYRKEVQ